MNRIGFVIVSVFLTSSLYFEFQYRFVVYYKIGICCFATKHAALRSKKK